MVLDELLVENFKGINELFIQFDSRVTAITGGSGTGKTSILEALKILASWNAAKHRNIDNTGLSITALDITNGKHYATLSIKTESLAWSVVKARKAKDTYMGHSEFKQLVNRARIAQEYFNSNSSVFLSVYYPANRAVIDISTQVKLKKRSLSQLDAHIDALTDSVNFNTFFEWFRACCDLELENKTKNHLHTSKALSALRYALAQFLPSLSSFEVLHNPTRIEVTKHNEVLRVNQLSSSEKLLIALIGDLVRRLSIANPSLDNPLEGKGLVLIDEIEMHLHPDLQQVIVPKLLKVFPNCQFVLTTNSPHVLSSMKSVQIKILNKFQDVAACINPAIQTYGMPSDEVLHGVLGIDPQPPTQEKILLQELTELIDCGEYASLRAVEIRKLLATDLGINHPQLQRLDRSIQRQELIKSYSGQTN